MGDSSFYRERRRIRKLRYVEDEYRKRGCSLCGYDTDAAALRVEPSQTRSPIRLAHDDATYARIDKRLKEARVMCLNCVAVEKAERLRERYA